MRHGLHKSWGVATDGAEVDIMGLIPLLREKQTSILAFYDNPQIPNMTTLPNLFGFNSTAMVTPFDCSGGTPSLVGTTAQVFKRELWPETEAHMQATDNTGVKVLKNVEVLANPALGVKEYTIDTLMIVDNQRKTAFEETVLRGTDIAQLEAEGYPMGGTMVVQPPVAVAMSLLVQWKLKQNLEAIKSAFGVVSPPTVPAPSSPPTVQASGGVAEASTDNGGLSKL